MPGLFLCKPPVIEWLERSIEEQHSRGSDFNFIETFECVGVSVNLNYFNQLYDQSSKSAFSTSKKVLCIFDGEIFNLKDLAELLKLDTSRHSAGKIIAELYENFGISFVDKLLGIFAIILYDFDKNHLIVNRDMVGLKPLYYSQKNEHLVFASSLNAIPLELIPYVKTFPPGAVWVNDGFKHINNVQIPQQNELETAMLNSISDHLPDNIDFALSLSGGIDSSIIAAMAKKLGYVFDCYVFDAGYGNDAAAAKAVTDELGLSLKVVKVDKADVIEMLPKIVKALGAFRSEVILGGVLSYAIAKAASSEGKKMLVTGEGVDVIFGGLPKYKIIPKHHLYNVMIEDQHKLWHSTNRRMDHIAMLCGVEPRAPLEDLRVIAKARQLPVKKILDLEHKFIDKIALREIALKYLPEDLVIRQKANISEGTGLAEHIIQIGKDFYQGNEINAQEKTNFEIDNRFEAICFKLWKEYYPNMSVSKKDLQNRVLFPSSDR